MKNNRIPFADIHVNDLFADPQMAVYGDRGLVWMVTAKDEKLHMVEVIAVDYATFMTVGEPFKKFAVDKMFSPSWKIS